MLITTDAAESQFLIDKDAIISIVRSNKCKDVRYLYDGTDYESLFKQLINFASTFSCSNMLSYLDSILEAVDTSVLTALGITHCQSVDSLSNNVFISKTAVKTLTINSSSNIIVIANGSNVNKLHITGGAKIELIIISGNSIVDELKVDGIGSMVRSVFLSNCRGSENVTNATLTLIDGNTDNVLAVSAPKGTVFGGYKYPDYSTTVPVTTTIIDTN